MSRQYNSHSDPAGYNRRLNQPYENQNYASRESPRTYPMGRPSPSNDQGPDKGEQQPRRRIGLAAPQYLLPAQDPSTSASAYGTQATPRHWTPIASNRQSNGLGYDTDPSFKFGPSGFPYLNSSAVVSIPENFGVNSLSLSRDIPRHGDRILPNPRRTSHETSSNSYPKSGESASYGVKSGAAWNPQTLTFGTSPGSISSTSLSAFSGSLSSVAYSSPSKSSQGAGTFGYVPVTSSSLHQPVFAAEQRSNLADVPIPKGRAILPVRPSSSLYSYSTGNGARSGSTTGPLSSEPPTLVNGGQYIRIQEKPVKHNPKDPLPVDQPILVPKPVQSTVTTHSQES
ncbi:MAG: hypothetical protein Q9170_002854 [Blastenia crenularia]